MSDHCEEQEMEAEALQAIFDTAFEAISSSFPGIEWSIKLLPVDCGRDESDDEEEDQNFVAIKLFAKLPMDYPELSLPELNIQIIKARALLTFCYPMNVKPTNSLYSGADNN